MGRWRLIRVFFLFGFWGGWCEGFGGGSGVQVVGGRVGGWSTVRYPPPPGGGSRQPISQPAHCE
jgi:hypothetical protein